HAPLVQAPGVRGHRLRPGRLRRRQFQETVLRVGPPGRRRLAAGPPPVVEQPAAGDGVEPPPERVARAVPAESGDPPDPPLEGPPGGCPRRLGPTAPPGGTNPRPSGRTARTGAPTRGRRSTPAAVRADSPGSRTGAGRPGARHQKHRRTLSCEDS